MGKLSIRKGSNFERQIAKIFSDWSGVKLVRTPMSGAWDGCEVDIWPENPEVYWPLAIECKKSEAWNMDQIMEGVGPFYDWLEQAEQQAEQWSERTGKSRDPILVFSRNRHPIYAAIPGRLWGLGDNLVSRLPRIITVMTSNRRYHMVEVSYALDILKYSVVKWVMEGYQADALRCEDSSQSIQTS